jgi:alkanesulfonate monooxygenase SsuD/methylene tetrahydromethanopterin reductase-like flavin-dependent oxidoreductase (luciferase family)
MGLLPSPEEAKQYPFTDEETEVVNQALASHLIGDPETVREGLLALVRRTDADEIMLSTRAHSYEDRARSMRLVAKSWELAPSVLPNL